MKRAAIPEHELNERGWHWIVLLGAGCAAVLAAVHLFGSGRVLTQWAGALAGGWAWFCAVRLLLLKTRLRIFWYVWLSLTLFLMLLLMLVAADEPEAAFIVGLIMSVALLTFRLYRPYRYLTSARRIVLGVGSLLLIIALPGALGRPEGSGTLTWFAHAFGLYALWSLKVFFGFTAVHLFLGMRLHFLRLKPKLAVTGFFLAGVPLVLLLLFSALTLSAVLIRDRSTIALRTLETEAATLFMGPPRTGAEYFEASLANGEYRISGSVEPVWFGALARAVTSPEIPSDSLAGEGDEPGPIEFRQRPDESGFTITVGGETDTLTGMAWTPADSTFLFQSLGELWVLDLQDVSGPEPQLRGHRIGDSFLDGIAARVGSDLRLRGTAGAIPDSVREQAVAEGWPGSFDQRAYRNPDDRALAVPDSAINLSPSLAILSCLVLDEGRFETGALILFVTTSPWQLLADLASGPNEADQLLLVFLVTFAIVFLVIELGALFLGIRITRGVTSAVSVLHAGTMRLAEGDLDTRIEIPNQDEFGDLATSFNEMTVAVRRGREEALARERLEKELETARSIQQKLLPDAMPAVPGFEFAATSIPSRQVGGDYFDFIETGESRLGVAIADVSGKGIPAALLMANLQAALQGQAIHPGNVAAVVARVNELLVKSSEVHMYATFFYGVLDRMTGRFTYCNAGHNPPLVQRADGRREFLETGGIVVGMMGGIAFEEETLELDPGDVIVMYTDGVSEAVGPEPEAAVQTQAVPVETPEVGDGEGEEAPAPVRAVAVEKDIGDASDGDDDEDEDDEWGEEENMFGEERLYDLVAAHSGESAAGIRDAIMGAVADFSAGMDQSDDITVLVLRRLTE